MDPELLDHLIESLREEVTCKWCGKQPYSFETLRDAALNEVQLDTNPTHYCP